MKRKITKYALATAFTGLAGLGAANAYGQIGKEPETMSLEKVKKVAISASLFAGIVWTIALL